MKECITLTQREQRRLLVVAKLYRGELRVEQAAAVLGLSVR
jgi:hypothetical protein